MRISLILLCYLITFLSKSQTIDELSKRLIELSENKKTLLGSLDVIEDEIVAIKKEISYLEYLNSSVLPTRFFVNARGGNYMMTKSFVGGDKINLNAGEKIELLDLVDSKIKVYAKNQFGYMWPGDISDQETVTQFTVLIEGQRLVEGKISVPLKSPETLEIENSEQKFKRAQEKEDDDLYGNSTNVGSKETKTTNNHNGTGRTYHRGPRGGCYYINSNGNKTYVDRSLCN